MLRQFDELGPLLQLRRDDRIELFATSDQRVELCRDVGQGRVEPVELTLQTFGKRIELGLARFLFRSRSRSSPRMPSNVA